MKTRTIWWIIAFMTLALVGIVTLQLIFISNSIKAGEEHFDNQVRSALKATSDDIDFDEDELVTRYNNGYSLQNQEKKSNGRFYVHATVIKLFNEQNGMALKGLEFSQIKQSLHEQPLVNRLDIDGINLFLKSALKERNIKIPYNYGIYSAPDNGFILVNGRIVEPHENQQNYIYLKNSEYKTTIFPKENLPPGALYIQFPTKTTIVWGDMLSRLVLSLLFTSIIIGCFAYTMYVVLHQKKVSEMKTDFINNMTHEFKTPIATISLAADAISNQNVISNPQKIQKFIGIIKQENKRMNGQVEKVLQMAQIEKGKYTLNVSEVDLHDIIEAAVENISLQVEKKDGLVTAQLNAQKPMVEGDGTHISNMINNLLDNANKYTPLKPQIIVSTRDVPNGVEVTVSDNGIGMSKEARKRIFEKFYRVSTGNVHDVKGFGLGLSYVKAMVTAHKGNIDVKSEPDKGSSFILFFPFKVQEERDGSVTL